MRALCRSSIGFLWIVGSEIAQRAMQRGQGAGTVGDRGPAAVAGAVQSQSGDCRNGGDPDRGMASTRPQGTGVTRDQRGASHR